MFRLTSVSAGQLVVYAYIHLQQRKYCVCIMYRSIGIRGEWENKSKENGLTLSMSNDEKIITKAN